MILNIIPEKESPYSIYGNNLEKLQIVTVENAVDSYYDNLEDMSQGIHTMRDQNDFTFVGKDLRLKEFPNVKLLRKKW